MVTAGEDHFPLTTREGRQRFTDAGQGNFVVSAGEGRRWQARRAHEGEDLVDPREQ